ncbi:uncharacterized protein RCO7_08045 [Rhynchosporium graminicola]|uniref:Uncharacterized protein n=1 Tax=Rhynchosporium graminicola TaxID=2792576 RepID=A0A1E1K6Z9_9HELO|nr:uncharacterized protein RCO7_08045 [Rhynchosporium commune]
MSAPKQGQEEEDKEQEDEEEEEEEEERAEEADKTFSSHSDSEANSDSESESPDPSTPSAESTTRKEAPPEKHAPSRSDQSTASAPQRASPPAKQALAIASRLEPPTQPPNPPIAIPFTPIQTEEIAALTLAILKSHQTSLRLESQTRALLLQSAHLDHKKRLDAESSTSISCAKAESEKRLEVLGDELIAKIDREREMNETEMRLKEEWQEAREKRSTKFTEANVKATMGKVVVGGGAVMGLGAGSPIKKSAVLPAIWMSRQTTKVGESSKTTVVMGEKAVEDEDDDVDLGVKPENATPIKKRKLGLD